MSNLHTTAEQPRRQRQRQEKPPVTCPFVIIVDTREQRRFTFAEILADRRADPLQRPIIIETVRGTLAQGDYSIVGFQDQVAIERKGAADLFNTIGQHRSRFERELARLQSSATFAAVVLECDWLDIINDPPPRSKLTAKTIFRSIVAWQQRFPRVHWWPCAGREMAEVVTYRILERFHFEQQRSESRQRTAESPGAE